MGENAHSVDGTERNLSPFAAYLQGLGIGLIAGAVAALGYGAGILYLLAAPSVVLIIAGYVIDKRSRGTGGERDE